jgi:hypothetical protein
MSFSVLHNLVDLIGLSLSRLETLFTAKAFHFPHLDDPVYHSTAAFDLRLFADPTVAREVRKLVTAARQLISIVSPPNDLIIEAAFAVR